MILSIIVRFIYEFYVPNPAFKAIERVGWLLCVSSLLPVFVRHYYLLEKANDLQLGLKSRLFLSTVKGAWMIYLVNGTIPVMVLITASIIKNGSMEDTLEVINDVASVLMLVQCLIATMFLCWYIFRAPNDRFCLKTQFITLVGFAITYSGVALMAQLFRVGEIEKNLLAVVLPMFVILMDYAWPVFVSMKVQKKNKKRNSIKSIKSVKEPKKETSVDSLCRKAIQRSTKSNENIELGSFEDELETILASEKLSQSFSRFLAQEYCLEYLMFLQDIETYRYTFYDLELNQIKQLKDQIVEEYLMPSAVNELDMPSRIQESYWLDQQIKPDLFLEAEMWVKQYLIDHHLSRFQNWQDDCE
jgi:hypothetical protein